MSELARTRISTWPTPGFGVGSSTSAILPESDILNERICVSVFVTIKIIPFF
ncbi:hypothetical protein D3C71_2182090 [compost metagenome]